MAKFKVGIVNVVSGEFSIFMDSISAAKYLGVHRNTLRNWLKDKPIKRLGVFLISGEVEVAGSLRGRKKNKQDPNKITNP